MQINIPWGDGTSDNIILDFSAIEEGSSNSINVSSNAITDPLKTRSKEIIIQALDDSGGTPNKATLTVEQNIEKIMVTISNN